MALGCPRTEAALELIATYGSSFRRTARRHSLCADDAEDAYARAVEILLTKAPPCGPPRLAAWMQTVTKREAMAVRRSRERLLSATAPNPDHEPRGMDSFPGHRPGPADRAERRERVARSAEALAALKPQERRALVLKAEGYSYAEIQELCGWTYTKVNRCMAEGRKAFLERFAAIYGDAA
ncbi:MAG: RNA polymerase sigma factor [Solirubrobacterales bacterium]